MKATTENLLLIFTRNPELGRCKTRLAAAVGKETALEIYKFLLEHTVKISRELDVEKEVYYSEEIWENDIWDNDIYSKKLQTGIDLGERMANAFKAGFKAGYKKIIIIGSDMYDLSQVDLQGAFETLEKADFVVGPAIDGGYYLLGMKTFKEDLFIDKAWGTGNVLKDTLKNLEEERFELLAERNDVDYFEDIKDVPAFQKFFKN
ncbi:TIGR04282 family arsenosugar biosynthesis glycosyltransferase [Croceivirga thetidis]|uniref:Glycosyltransferase n=1 Tax=Croceivirga thetidis TaxID=2721623 RepID=A0ABX1GRL0_9FLAO|nr:TIGR04282 family arsenosugar biosynthesis glycosyltransferase [Croceivirga thetidis]NKI31671.1 glycosyltransferase [Croceivirga thetidis]